jgi:hypothetical protein
MAAAGMAYDCRVHPQRHSLTSLRHKPKNPHYSSLESHAESVTRISRDLTTQIPWAHI